MQSDDLQAFIDEVGQVVGSSDDQYEITELYRAARDRRPAAVEPTGSYLDFSDAELTEIDRYATESDINLWSESSDV